MDYDLGFPNGNLILMIWDNLDYCHQMDDEKLGTWDT